MRSDPRSSSCNYIVFLHAQKRARRRGVRQVHIIQVVVAQRASGVGARGQITAGRPRTQRMDLRARAGVAL
jgi:hypothetical protein